MTAAAIPQEPTEGERFWTVLFRLATVVRDHLRVVAGDLGLSPPALHLLLELDDAPQAQRDLARTLLVDPSMVTAMVDSLEQRRLVERHPHPSDRRVKLVEVTAAGEAVRRDLRRALSTLPASVAGMSAHDRARLLSLLEQAADPSDC